MPFLRRLRIRQQLLVAYAGVATTAAAALVWCRPGDAWGIVAMALASGAAGWLVVHIGNRRLKQRLHELREITDALGHGDFARHIRTLPSDDFVKLAASVERLSALLREMAAEQDRLRQRLSRSEKLAVMGELAAIVAHEVNNPLDGLQNSIRIIRRREDTNADTRALLDMMEAGLGRIENTVGRLLSMSRDEPIQLLPASVEKMVDDALMFVQPRLNRYGVQLVRDLPADDLKVKADADHLVQALINLMINAADAMKDAGGMLTVRCGTAGDDDRAFIEIVDTGSGIEEHVLDRIFEPFYSTKGKGAGTGLGLAVVARVVEAHHGRVEVKTQPGVGTSFRIEIPMAAVVEPPRQMPVDHVGVPGTVVRKNV